jgi:hypothetical protein
MAMTTQITPAPVIGKDEKQIWLHLFRTSMENKQTNEANNNAELKPVFDMKICGHGCWECLMIQQ